VRHVSVRLLLCLVAVASMVLGSTRAGAGSLSGEIAYSGNGKIYVVNADGSDRRVLVSAGSRLRVDNWGGIAWSRDGAQIAFTVGDYADGGDFWGETLRLYLAAADGTHVRPLGGTGKGSHGPTWSPDNSQIAFATRTVRETTISVIGTDGTGLRTIVRRTSLRIMLGNPDWSPEGGWILFESFNDLDGFNSLMAVRPDGTGLHRLARLQTWDFRADWSPDGARIAYQAPKTPPGPVDVPEDSKIWVMNADGSGRIRLTHDARPYDENPDWSPDGKRITFYSDRSGNEEIYWIPSSGGQARRVTHDPWQTGPPRWRPPG
jgi:Tol biopolymer transport system component